MESTVNISEEETFTNILEEETFLSEDELVYLQLLGNIEDDVEILIEHEGEISDSTIECLPAVEDCVEIDDKKVQSCPICKERYVRDSALQKHVEKCTKRRDDSTSKSAKVKGTYILHILCISSIMSLL